MKLSATFISITLLAISLSIAGCQQNDNITGTTADTSNSSHSFEQPKGWIIGGNEPNSYEMGIDKGAGQSGKNAATIKSTAKYINGFGTLTQEFQPDKYLGKRIRMSGNIKTRNVDNWASLWLRIDQENSDQPFKNLADRVIKGTSGWEKYDIVLDVPAKATNIAFGALLSGTGQIWLDDLTFEIVDETVPITGKAEGYKRGNEPVNLDFEE